MPEAQGIIAEKLTHRFIQAVGWKRPVRLRNRATRPCMLRDRTKGLPPGLEALQRLSPATIVPEESSYRRVAIEIPGADLSPRFVASITVL